MAHVVVVFIIDIIGEGVGKRSIGLVGGSLVCGGRVSGSSVLS